MKTRFLFFWLKLLRNCAEYIAYNGKSIGEVRAFEEPKVQERQNVADAFFGLLNYKNNQYEKAAADKYYKKFNWKLSPAFCQYYVIGSAYFFLILFLGVSFKLMTSWFALSSFSLVLFNIDFVSLSSVFKSIMVLLLEFFS